MKARNLVLGGALALLTLPTSALLAQSSAETQPPQDWHLLDAQKDGFRGVSAERAYQELLKGRKPSRTIVVAVIDGGVDVNHPDLAGRIWVNPREISGNGKDDDGNGYIDDINGWSFIGGPNGSVMEDNFEVTREYRRLRDKFNPAISNATKRDPEYKRFKEIKAEFAAERKKYTELLAQYRMFLATLSQAYNAVKASMGVDTLTAEQVANFTPRTEMEQRYQRILAYAYEQDLTLQKLRDGMRDVATRIDYGLNLEFDPRSIVGDNYDDLSERFYGSTDVIGGRRADHGTHVAGIIAAVRDNNIGMRGIADSVRIMVLRVVPDGDERDKDIANAIRYAVDNGAQIINMSFGKAYSPHKAVVDDAVRYAASKGVLMVHASGNDAQNIEVKPAYPTGYYADDSSRSPLWIEIGASSWKDAEFVGSFSNYGPNAVDIFSPGVRIYSTVWDNKYENNDGTSMAAPAFSGVAAALWSYFPNLTAQQVRDILLDSGELYPDAPVKRPSEGEDEGEEVRLTDLCRTGAIVNLYNAVRMAEDVSRGRPVTKGGAPAPVKVKKKKR